MGRKRDPVGGRDPVGRKRTALDAEGNPMNATCECGMTLEAPSRRTGCEECGTVGCRSCSIEMETITYCRWCATFVAQSHAA